MKRLPLLFSVGLALIPLLWYIGHPGTLINGVDTNFPLEPVHWFFRRFYVWNSVSNAGADFSASTAGLFFHLIQVVPFLLGASIFLTQKISLVFWFGAIVLTASKYFRHIFPKHPWIALLAVFFYISNPYTFNSWENVKVANLSLLSALPLYLYLLHTANTTNTVRKLWILVCSFLIAGAGINPAYILSMFLTGGLYAILIGISVRSLVMTSIPLVLINSYWIIPSFFYILTSIQGSGSIDSIGFNSWVDSLSKNTSLLNILRVQGAWDWYAFDGANIAPLYIPYAVNYLRTFPFVSFSFLIPFISISALVIRRKSFSELSRAFAVLALIGVFLGSGTHEPTGPLFAFFVKHVPFFSLFRSPWYIFSTMVTISYAGLIGIFLVSSQKYFGKLTGLVIVILFVGNALYSYPLLTGKIFRPAKSDGFYVQFPEYVFDAGTVIDETVPPLNRIAGYPNDEIERYDWGYVGIESLVNLIAKSDTIYSPLNGVSTPLGGMIQTFYSDLMKGQIEAAQSVARKLAISHLLYKLDQPSLSPALVLDQFPRRSIGKWDIVSFPTDPIEKISLVTTLYTVESQSDSAHAAEFLPKESGTVLQTDSVINSIEPLKQNVGSILSTSNSHDQYRAEISRSEFIVSSTDMTHVVYEWSQNRELTIVPVMESYGIISFGIDPRVPILATLDDTQITLNPASSDDSHIYFKPITFSPGDHKLIIPLKNENKLSKAINHVQEKDGQYILTNKTEYDMNVSFEISDFNPFFTYLFTFKNQRVIGSNGLALVAQVRGSTNIKNQVEKLGEYSASVPYQMLFEPVKTQSTAQFSLIAPKTKDPAGTIETYSDVKGYPLFLNKLFFMVEPELPIAKSAITGYKVSPVKYRGLVTHNTNPHIIVFSESYSPYWSLRVPVGTQVRHFTINGYANGWYVSGAPASYEFEIYYLPQYLRMVGIVLSTIAIIGVIWRKKA